MYPSKHSTKLLHASPPVGEVEGCLLGEVEGELGEVDGCAVAGHVGKVAFNQFVICECLLNGEDKQTLYEIKIKKNNRLTASPQYVGGTVCNSKHPQFLLQHSLRAPGGSIPSLNALANAFSPLHKILMFPTELRRETETL